MIRINWFHSEGTEKRSGRAAESSERSYIIIDVKIHPDNNVVNFEAGLRNGRVESTIKFSESPPAEVQTNAEVVKWVESNIDQLVQNALVKLLTTAVGFFS